MHDLLLVLSFTLIEKITPSINFKEFTNNNTCNYFFIKSSVRKQTRTDVVTMWYGRYQISMDVSNKLILK